MKVSGWVYSDLDMGHGQHSYKGTIKKNDVKVKIDLYLYSCKLKGKVNGECVAKIPSKKKVIDQYHEKCKEIVQMVFAEIQKAAESKGLPVAKMTLKIKDKK